VELEPEAEEELTFDEKVARSSQSRKRVFHRPPVGRGKKPRPTHIKLVEPRPDDRKDFSKLDLKKDHANRAMWVLPDGHVFLETFSRIYSLAYDFLVAIAEPKSRPAHMHEYVITEYSLFAAASVGLDPEDIIVSLNRFSKNEVPDQTLRFIRDCCSRFGKLKIVLESARYFLESPDKQLLTDVMQHPTMKSALIDVNAPLIERAAVSITKTVLDVNVEKPAASTTAAAGKAAPPSTAKLPGAEPEPKKKVEIRSKNKLADDDDNQAESDVDDGDHGKRMDVSDEDEEDIPVLRDRSLERMRYLVEIRKSEVVNVRRMCLELRYPSIEEYDFAHDKTNATLDMDLRSAAQIRPYQSTALGKMFGNNRARSGIIVLPCGAGKTLVGITACVTMKKSCLVLCTNNVSVHQWHAQFRKWCTVNDMRLVIFTSQQKVPLENPDVPQIVLTTFSMLTASGTRSNETQAILDQIHSREWGLLLLDEVHVVPAKMFRKVISMVFAHCKLGLTATLVREDEAIDDLNFLIGPKLYEANWLDLQHSGYLAAVQCNEVWCPMAPEFYREYLITESAKRKQLLFWCNPNKFRACQFLVRFHERRGDKIIIFSDIIYVLRLYATLLNAPFIDSECPDMEKEQWLRAFRTDPKRSTILLSRVGDTSIDLPDANVVIQVTSHFGARRQEAQRLGRILRPKQHQSLIASKNIFNAYFYTLVSKDTKEMLFSSKRQQFLVDQGYAFRVVNDLEHYFTPDEPLGLSTMEEQQKVLADIMKSKDEDAELEELAEDRDPESGISLRLHGRRRRVRSSEISGGGDALYTEFEAQEETTAMPLKQRLKRHILFRRMYNDRKY
jgi:DNA excision repair protein ERCC-3